MSPNLVLGPPDLEKDYNNGDWTVDPWFLQEEISLLEQMGFPLSLRHKAAQELRMLYTPEVCRSSLSRKWYGALVFNLFKQTVPWFLIPLLRVGLDAEIAQPWEDLDLLSKLRNRETFEAAAYELSVWANLKRFGFEFEREPPTATASRPDFSVRLGTQTYFLELKTVEMSDAENLAQEFQNLFLLSLAPFFAGWTCIIEPSEALAQGVDSQVGRDQLREDQQRIVAAFVTKAFELQKLRTPGAQTVPPFGTIELVPSADPKQWAIDIRLVAEVDPLKKAARVCRTIKDAAGQLSQAGRSIILVRLDSFADFQLIRSNLTERIKREPERYRHCDLVLLHARGRLDGTDGEVVPFIHPISMPWHHVTPEQKRLGEQLLYQEGRNSLSFGKSRMGLPGWV